MHIVLLALSVMLLSAHGLDKVAPSLIEISPANLPGKFARVRTMGLDISPDEKLLAVEFETVDDFSPSDDARNQVPIIRIWVGVWRIQSKQLITYKSIAGPLKREEWTNPRFTHDLRYSPDGQKLVVQIGPRIEVLNASSLESVYFVGPSDVPYEPRTHFAISQFDLSADSRYMAVLTSTGEFNSPKQSAVAIIDFKTGDQLSLWKSNRLAATISLSPDGKQLVLMGNIVRDGDVGIFSSQDGKAVSALETGFADLGSSPDAKWLDSDHFAVVPGTGTDAQGRYAGGGILIVDVPKGKVTRTLTVKRFGPLGILANSANAPVIATVHSWQSRREVRSDFKRGKPNAELLLFRYDTGAVQTTPLPLQNGSTSKGRRSFSLRVSSHARYVGLFEGDTAKVFEVSPWPALVKQ
jgi:hypothetical protein